MRVRLDIFKCQFNATFFTQGHIQNAFYVRHILIAKCRLKLYAPLSSGFSSGNVDDTANGVSSKERALWTAQDFDRFNIKHVKYRARVAGHKHTIDSDTNSWLKRLFYIVVANTANTGTQRL